MIPTAIVNWERPTDIQNLGAFTGSTGYFRSLIKGYATVVQPLTISAATQKIGGNLPREVFPDEGVGGSGGVEAYEEEWQGRAEVARSMTNGVRALTVTIFLPSPVSGCEEEEQAKGGADAPSLARTIVPSPAVRVALRGEDGEETHEGSNTASGAGTTCAGSLGIT
ncbi:hypothetical protein FB451DRAFT_1176715 [Mycena latifolia]|nr:hypothetical protein FB451DRAFT_1176715 [Mycena latifolia]